MSKKRKLLLPTLTNKMPATYFPTPGKQPSKRQRLDCWKNAAGLETEMPCPGCYRVILTSSQKNGWHASHIRSRSLGGSTQMYNLYPLCDVCNGDMENTNMYCYFFNDVERSQALDKLIATMHTVFRINYAEKYNAFNGQFHLLAEYYYGEKQRGDGGIPLDHPVFRYFLEYDIRINNRAVLEAKKEYDRLYTLAQEINRKYRR